MTAPTFGVIYWGVLASGVWVGGMMMVVVIEPLTLTTTEGVVDCGTKDAGELISKVEGSQVSDE